jgi:hypothetical protein
VSKPGGLKRIRREALRRARRRAFFVLALLPVPLFFLAFEVAIPWFQSWEEPKIGGQLGNLLEGPSWGIWVVMGIAIPVTGFLAAILFYLTVRDVRAAFRDDPIVLRCKVVKREEGNAFDDVSSTMGAMYGYNLLADVERAVRIGRDGSTSWDPKLLGSEKRVPTTWRVYDQAPEAQEVVLICNSAGRAVALLSDLHDDEAAKELITVLDTAPAPEPKS